jgi:iron complex outermembrane recepter protein
MKKIIPFLATVVLLLLSQMVFSQKTISGKIKDEKGNPLSGISIKVKNSTKGTSTADDGSFSIIVNDNDVLEITGVGLQAQTIKIGNRNSVDISMQPQVTDGDAVVVLGSRGTARAKTETAIPVDVIKINQVGLPTAKMDLTSVLNAAAPSFNYNKQSGSDGADHVDIGTLRGLGPDQTLVLLNGKRRHSTSFVALFGTRGRGQSGTDLNAFAQSSVDRIEILRDGASAQYGSDAIAGVMNIILKKDVNHWNITAGAASYYDTKFNSSKLNSGNPYYSGNKLDGTTYSFSVNNGLAIGKEGGFINFSFDYLNQGKTFRQVDTLNWKTDKNALPYLNTGRRAFGDGSVETYGGMYNMEMPLSKKNKTTFYSFGGANQKKSEAYAYTRNWSGRPERFPTDLDGNLLFDGDIMRKDKSGEIYYNPLIQTDINDASIAAGIKGETSGWKWDLSTTNGKNDFHYFGAKTFNASIKTFPGKTNFDDGGFNFIQNTLNFDMSKSFATVASGLNLGLGAEYRNEKYNIYAGELASYFGYYTTDIFYPNVGESRTPAAGSQGFPGFSNADAINAKRSNFAFYADAELNASKEILFDGAYRFENYSDFGAVSTFKLASRIKASSKVNIRGSLSSGFRAPSLQQINFSNTLTSFSNGQLVQSLIARNGSGIANAAGIPSLKEETSVNYSLGFTWKAAKGLTFTVDGYQIKIKDRVVLSGLFSSGDPTLPASFTAQIPSDVSTVQFFANAVNTTNFGLDIVANYNKNFGSNKSLKILLAGNLQKTNLDKVNVPSALNSTELNQKTFYSDREIAFLKASAPTSKFSLNVDYTMDKFTVGAHLTSFGSVKLLGFGTGTAVNPNYAGINPQVPSDLDGSLVDELFDYKAKLVTDLYVSYKITKGVSIFLGADNVLNTHPNLGVNPLAKGYAQDNESGGAWDSVQMGFNGRRIFAKLAFNF